MANTNHKDKVTCEIVEQVAESPAAFFSSNLTLSSPSNSVSLSLKPFVASSSAGCCTNWQMPTLYVLVCAVLSFAFFEQAANEKMIANTEITAMIFLNVFIMIFLS